MSEQDTLGRPAEQLTWADALQNYRSAEAAYADVASEYLLASRKYEASTTGGEEFSALGLQRWSDTANRDGLMMRAEMSLVLRDHKGRTDSLTPKELGALREKAARIVDDFIDWHGRWCAASKVFEPTEQKHDSACDRLFEARKELLKLPAPDTEAMLFKLDLLAKLLRECDSEDAGSVESLRDDAQRLFGAQ